MILNRDGQSGLLCEDSIRNHSRWSNSMDVALCNPPFGSRTAESDQLTLAAYDLGHVWRYNAGKWEMTSEVMASQQLGILFVERCWKLLRTGGRLGIIWPEGYLSTASYGYVRQWLLDKFQIQGLVELPRRIFTKSEADLRSNIVIAIKIDRANQPRDYPIYAGLVRKVGYKLGGDFSATPARDEESGIEIRDTSNALVLDSDFLKVARDFAALQGMPTSTCAHLSDVTSTRSLDLKARRLVPRALQLRRSLEAGPHVRLGDIAEVVTRTVDLVADIGASSLRRPVEGQNIRAVEGIVSPQDPERCWSIAHRKSKRVYELRKGDVIVGLVRPERRNVGVLLDVGDDIVGVTDALAVVRLRETADNSYSQEWLFAALRAESTRIQFWTEAGGTSYGKLTLNQIEDVILSDDPTERMTLAVSTRKWMNAVESMYEYWATVGTLADRQAILNSPLTGLADDDD